MSERQTANNARIPTGAGNAAVAALVTWFGAGRLPGAPGTWGSLAALPFAWLIAGQGGALGLAAAAVVVTVVGIAAAHSYCRRTGEADPSRVVIDEVAGQWVALIGAPLDPVSYLVGFALFRVFDITKPWPANWIDRNVPGGLGVMADDLVAGAYAAAALQMLTRLLPPPWNWSWA